MIFPIAFASLSRRILNSENPFSRSNQLGHITVSGLVIKDDSALLIFHPYIKDWFQPGGHIDDGEDPIDAVIREVYEETGVVCERIAKYADPIDIDLHEIAANPKKGEGLHLHIDLLFLLKAIEENKSPEGIEKAWVPVDQITSPRIKRALQKLQDYA